MCPGPLQEQSITVLKGEPGVLANVQKGKFSTEDLTRGTPDLDQFPRGQMFSPPGNLT